MKDLLEQISPGFAEKELFWARTLCFIWGISVTILAVIMVSGQLTIIERFNSIYQLFAGPLAGIFLLGILSKRTSAAPVLLGAFVGFGAAIYIQQTTAVHWLWFSPIGLIITALIGYFGSFIIPRRELIENKEVEKIADE